MVLGREMAEQDQRAIRLVCRSPHSCAGSPRSEGLVHGLLRLRRTGLSGRGDVNAMNSASTGRRLASPIRLTLAAQLGGDLDGAWWPRSAYVAGELPELIEALHKYLGQVIDISVNWSSNQSSPDLDSLGYRGSAAHPVRVAGHQRLMTVIGTDARANLLVVPCLTTSALAVMLLRQAAALPIPPAEHETRAFLAADGIVRAARAESAQCALLRKGKAPTAHGDTEQIQR
jgi:hypothetical protein